MEYLLTLFIIISAILAGMGVGGGALFVILVTTLLDIPQKDAQFLNLILFIAVSISTTISNIKDKKINFKIVKKIFAFLIIGSLIGTEIIESINNENLKKYFSFFMLALGLYEIISSLIHNKKAKNINRE